MRFERLRTVDHHFYSEAMELYAVSFPLHEQRMPASQEQIMGCGEYQFNLIFDEDSMVGILLCWETGDFIYVEHFCILPEMRGRKYGDKALELLKQRGKRVILEIDPPVDAISIRRKGFYERAGFQAAGVAHIHPPYRKGCDGHALVVMSYPEGLTEAEYRPFSQYLKTTVMGG